MDEGSPQQQVLYATARALAESETLEEAAPRMLKAICDALGWQYGAIWEVDRARNVLRCVATWHPAGLPFEAFEKATMETRLGHGIGLPGRVWASFWAGTTPSEKPAYTSSLGKPAAARSPAPMISPKPPSSVTCARPSSIEPNVRPPKRSGVWTVWPARRSSSAKA